MHDVKRFNLELTRHRSLGLLISIFVSHLVVVVLLLCFFPNGGFFFNVDDGLPEPPMFLRDIVYPPDGQDPRYDSDGPAPYHPPSSPGRQRQVHTGRVCAG